MQNKVSTEEFLNQDFTELNNKLHYRLDNLIYDKDMKYDVKFGEFIRLQQSKTTYLTDKQISKQPELLMLAQIICAEAIEQKATDIQILKINPTVGVVRLRKGNEMIPYRRLHGYAVDGLCTVYKGMSKVNIEEKEQGQDGRFVLTTRIQPLTYVHHLCQHRMVKMYLYEYFIQKI